MTPRVMQRELFPCEHGCKDHLTTNLVANVFSRNQLTNRLDDKLTRTLDSSLLALVGVITVNSRSNPEKSVFRLH